MMTKPTVGGIISGIGNVYGFYQAGFKPKFIIDNRSFFNRGVDTLIKNLPGCKFSKSLDAFQSETPDVIISSPSCAQISNLGMKRKDRKKLKTDMQMEEFEFIQVLNTLFERRPKFFVVEYLKSLLNHFRVTHKGIYQESSDKFLPFPEEYRVQILELDAKTYGVPQTRRRLFIFFSKIYYDFVYIPPETMTLKNLTVRETIKELDKARSERPLHNDQIPNHSEARKAKFATLKQGESYYGGQNNRRLKQDQVCPVITSHCTRHVHPTEDRVLNIRETATFQGFPLDFVFYGPQQVQLDLIGKTIPPPVTKHFGESILHCLEHRKENV